MRIIDPGHTYALDIIDDTPRLTQNLVFVKREGEKYPGNHGSYPGTQSQEVMRALIDRAKYVNQQEPHEANTNVITCLRFAIYALEKRAADRHGRDFINFALDEIEKYPTCVRCGHIGCEGKCR